MAQAAVATNIIKPGKTRASITRTIFRWIHIVGGIPILGYIYDSPSDTPNYAHSIRYFLVPLLLVSGLWMWKGHVVRRLFLRVIGQTKRSTKLAA
jgi:hypothetical protein